MKILFLTQLFPHPPVCGGTIRSFNTLRHLANGHEVTLAAFVRSEPTPESMSAAHRLCSDVRTVQIRRSPASNLKFAATSLLGRIPFIVARDFVQEMDDTVDQLLSSGRFDLVYVDHLQMAQYVMSRTDCPMVLDQHNVEWKIVERIGACSGISPKRAYAALEWRKLRRWELAACERFDKVLTVTETDRRTFERANPKLDSVTCIPIGVDFDEFPKVELDPNARDIVSIGTMSWPPNIDAVTYFAEKILPLIKQQTPESEFVVVGSNPPASVRRLSEKDESVRVMGFVEDVSTIARNAAAFVVPLRSGSGLRVKILNAMAMGLPVVSTSVGCEGIGGRPGTDLLVADDDREFADAVTSLIDDFNLRRRVAESGREFVLRNYSWDAILGRLDEAIASIQNVDEGEPSVTGRAR